MWQVEEVSNSDARVLMNDKLTSWDPAVDLKVNGKRVRMDSKGIPRSPDTFVVLRGLTEVCLRRTADNGSNTPVKDEVTEWLSQRKDILARL
ncbi:MAG: hypothetical protein J4432_00120 [DPANN group archaeon]|nr:hypothetical protein [DPANN group archaeon]